MAPGGLVEVRVSWLGYPRYLKKKKKKMYIQSDTTHMESVNRGIFWKHLNGHVRHHMYTLFSIREV